MLKIFLLSRAKFPSDQRCKVDRDYIPCFRGTLNLHWTIALFFFTVFYVWLKPYLLFTTNVLILVSYMCVCIEINMF